MKKYLTIKDLAEMMQVHQQTVYVWVKEGKIPFTKLPSGSIRFDPDRIENWFNNRTARVKQ